MPSIVKFCVDFWFENDIYLDSCRYTFERRVKDHHLHMTYEYFEPAMWYRGGKPYKYWRWFLMRDLDKDPNARHRVRVICDYKHTYDFDVKIPEEKKEYQALLKRIFV